MKTTWATPAATTAALLPRPTAPILPLQGRGVPAAAGASSAGAPFVGARLRGTRHPHPAEHDSFLGRIPV